MEVDRHSFTLNALSQGLDYIPSVSSNFFLMFIFLSLSALPQSAFVPFNKSYKL